MGFASAEMECFWTRIAKNVCLAMRLVRRAQAWKNVRHVQKVSILEIQSVSHVLLMNSFLVMSAKIVGLIV